MIDWTCAAELRAEVGDEDFREIVGLFLDEADEAIDRLPTVASGPALEELLHFLKGSALNLGFVTFSEMCKDGELKVRGGQADTVDRPAITACYQASKAEFLNAGQSG